MKKTLKGFTLIEMLIVIVIIGILAAVLIPKIGGAREKANDVAVKANVRSYAQGILQMQLAGQTPPTALECGEGETNCLNSTANAQAYNYNYVGDPTGYSYAYDTTNKKFLVCGTVSTGGNSSAAASAENAATRTESTEGTYYCYQG